MTAIFRADAGDITTDPMEHAGTRTYARQGTTRQDIYTHNDRSALTAATLGTDACGYTYDNDADGGKASWTNAQHLPEGREAERRLRVNIGNRKLMIFIEHLTTNLSIHEAYKNSIHYDVFLG